MEPGLVTDLAILVCALLLDYFIGEYPALVHPVVWIGKFVTLLLRLGPRSGWWRQFVFGMFLAAGVTALCDGAASPGTALGQHPRSVGRVDAARRR